MIRNTIILLDITMSTFFFLEVCQAFTSKVPHHDFLSDAHTAVLIHMEHLRLFIPVHSLPQSDHSVQEDVSVFRSDAPTSKWKIHDEARKQKQPPPTPFFIPAL